MGVSVRATIIQKWLSAVRVRNSVGKVVVGEICFLNYRCAITMVPDDTVRYRHQTVPTE